MVIHCFIHYDADVAAINFDPIEIIAEVGSVHDGSFGNALKLVECAAEAGATVVKFQLHIANAETTRGAPNPKYFTAESRFDYFERISFSTSQWIEIRDLCKSLGVKFGCSPFSLEAVDFLLDIGVDVLKIPSGEVTNHPLIRRVAQSNLPIHLSSGMSNWHEIDLAMEILSDVKSLVLMQCTSLYPASPANVGLNIISEMIKRYGRDGCKIGFSDHSRGVVIPIAAATLGARAIEKHLTFSRKMYGSDAFNALEPTEFAEMCQSIGIINECLFNQIDKDSLENVWENREIFQKSLFVGKQINAGDVLSLENVKFLKPGTGISPTEWDRIQGRRVIRSLKEGEMLKMSDLE